MSFWRKWRKTVSGGQVPHEGASDDEQEYNFFYGKWGLNSSNFFEDSIILYENNGKKNLIAFFM